MELFKRHKTTPRGPSKPIEIRKKVSSKVLKHFKIIGTKDFIKTGENQEILIFEAFSTYGVQIK